MNKFFIECFENGKYKATLKAVFETRELARDFIHLYLEGSNDCTFLVTPIDYYFN